MYFISLLVYLIYYYLLSLIVIDYLCINVGLLKFIKVSRVK